MTSQLDFELRQPDEDVVLQPQNAAEFLATLDSGEEMSSNDLDCMQRDTAPEQMDAYSTETPGESLADRQIGQSRLPDDANFSGDLISAYFRQMGNGALLSHEEEIALAKRIEAWQKVILNQLCRVPMLVERVLQWADELRQGSRRLRDFVEISALSQGTRLYDGAEQDADGALPKRRKQLPRPSTSLAVSPIERPGLRRAFSRVRRAFRTLPSRWLPSDGPGSPLRVMTRISTRTILLDAKSCSRAWSARWKASVFIQIASRTSSTYWKRSSARSA